MFVVKVPGRNGLGHTKGCERAGNKILDILKKDVFSTHAGEEIDFDKIDLEEIHLDNSNLRKSNKLIYENAFESFGEHPKTIFLGGDHSISYSLTRAFFDFVAESNEKKSQNFEPCLIVFDAHADLMPVPKGNEKFPTHEEWLRALIDKGFPVENILLIGARNIDKKERDFLKKDGRKIKRIYVKDIQEDLLEITDTITEFAQGKKVYVSIDIDVIDPVFAPSTGYIEPGGITSSQLIYILQRLNMIKSMIGVDIVEINSKKDKKRDFLTVKLGARLLAEVLK